MAHFPSFTYLLDFSMLYIFVVLWLWLPVLSRPSINWRFLARNLLLCDVSDDRRPISIQIASCAVDDNFSPSADYQSVLSNQVNCVKLIIDALITG